MVQEEETTRWPEPEIAHGDRVTIATPFIHTKDTFSSPSSSLVFPAYVKMSRKAKANSPEETAKTTQSASKSTQSTTTGALYNSNGAHDITSTSATRRHKTTTVDTTRPKDNTLVQSKGAPLPILSTNTSPTNTNATKPPNNAQLKERSLQTSPPRNRMMSFFMETIPSFLAVSVMLSLIFGGCCSNVFALEAIIKPNPDSGTLLTFLQFLFIAAIGYSNHFSFAAGPSRLFLKPMRVPLKRWLVNITLFFTINVLNNHAFSYNISVPIHIILRSGGSITTIAVGYLWGKRFSRTQILSVLLLTVGVITAAWSDQQQKAAQLASGQAPPTSSNGEERPAFSYGLMVLFVAQVLSAVMGIYTEETYRTYGPQWKENLFYSHFVALPLFLPFACSMWAQLQRLAASEPLQLPWTHLGQLEGWGDEGWTWALKKGMGVQIPSQLAYLALNVLTQYACIRGVNLLASTSSALTVTIVLNVRKLVSLLLSIWLFGNKLSPGTVIGAGIVFTSGGMYSLDKGGKKARGRPRAQTGTALKELKELEGDGKVG